MSPIQHLQLLAQAAEAALLSGPDRDRVRESIQALAKVLQPPTAPDATTPTEKKG